MAPEHSFWIRLLFRIGARNASEAELGDMAEEYAGGKRSVLWLARQVLSTSATYRPHVPVRGRRAHAERSFAWLEDVRRDIGYAARTLSRNRTFATMSVATLALGIGATTAVFSAVHGVLVRPLPYRHSDRLVRVVENVPAAETRDQRPQRVPGLSGPELRELQLHVPTLAGVAGYGPALVTVSGVGPAVRLSGSAVSPALFRVLGVRPFIGRELEPADADPGAPNVIVLSHRVWRRNYAGDPRIVGQAITLETVFPPGSPKAYTVVGVMEASLGFPDGQADFWIPSLFSQNWRPPVLARLADGAGITAAAAEVDSVLRAFRGQAPIPSTATARPRFELVRAQDELVASQRPALLVLAGAVVLVLLIACVNVANLMLGRAAARERELSIRMALGAGRGRLIRQLLTESVLLALAGGLVGVAVAVAGVRLVRTLGTTLSRVDVAATGGLPRLEEVAVDGPVLVFAVLVSLTSGLLFGLAPAVRHARADANGLLRQRALGGVGSEAVKGRSGVLVVAEVAMAAMLLVGGGLLINSFARLSTVDKGYQAEDLLTFQVTLPPGRYPEVRQQEFAEALAARLRAVPNVRGVAYARQLPLVKLQDSFAMSARPETGAPPPAARVDARAVSRDYLRVIGVRTVTGRTFEESDGGGRPRVLVINEALARRDFGREHPVGRTVYLGRDPVPWTIVGVVANVRQRGLAEEPQPQLFIDLRQWPDFGPRFPLGAYHVARTSGDSNAAIAAIRRAVTEADPEASLANVATMEQLIVSTIWAPRLYAALMGVFAGVAGALAAVGIYGVVSYAVTRRTREIGIRMALGAPRLAVLGSVVGETMAPAAWGMVLGIAGAALLARSLDRMLFGLTPFDPATYVLVAVSLGLIAAVAAFVPARRAVAIDPLLALRHE